MKAQEKNPGRLWRLTSSSVPFFLCLAAAAFSQTTSLNPPDSAKDSLMEAQILDISMGMHVKLVWERAVTKSTMAYGPIHVLVGFDTYEKKERVIQSEVGEYSSPFITRDGTRIIWNNAAKSESWICNWDGTGKTLLFSGDTATHPAWISSTRWDSVGKQDYIYVGASNTAGSSYFEYQHDQPGIYSYPLNGLKVDTARRRVVWDSAQAGSNLCGANYFSVSADGLYGAGQMNGGINCLGFIDLVHMKIVETRLPSAGPEGCMPHCAPDNSRMWEHSMAGHSWIHLYRYGGTDNSIYVRPDSLYPNSGVWSYSGFEMPRWSNHPRFITGTAAMAFPNDSNWDLATFKSQFYLERFNAGFTRIEKIVQVSHAPRGYASGDGDAWFDLSGASNARSDHSYSAIGNASRTMQNGVVCDIRGRKIEMSRSQSPKNALAESTGACVIQGHIQVRMHR
jgi:hypothetical protein